MKNKLQNELVKWFKDERKDNVKELQQAMRARDHSLCMNIASKIDYIDYVIAEFNPGGTLNWVFEVDWNGNEK